MITNIPKIYSINAIHSNFIRVIQKILDKMFLIRILYTQVVFPAFPEGFQPYLDLQSDFLKANSDLLHSFCHEDFLWVLEKWQVDYNMKYYHQT